MQPCLCHHACSLTWWHRGCCTCWSHLVPGHHIALNSVWTSPHQPGMRIHDWVLGPWGCLRHQVVSIKSWHRLQGKEYIATFDFVSILSLITLYSTYCLFFGCFCQSVDIVITGSVRLTEKKLWPDRTSSGYKRTFGHGYRHWGQLPVAVNRVHRTYTTVK